MFKFKKVISVLLVVTCILSLLAGCKKKEDSAPAPADVPSTSVEDVVVPESIGDLIGIVEKEGLSFYGTKDSINKDTGMFNPVELNDTMHAYVYSTTSSIGNISVSTVDTYYIAEKGHTIYETWEDEDAILMNFFYGEEDQAEPEDSGVEDMLRADEDSMIEESMVEDSAADLESAEEMPSAHPILGAGKYKYVLVESSIVDTPTVMATAIRIMDDTTIHMVSVEINDATFVNDFVEMLAAE